MLPTDSKWQSNFVIRKQNALTFFLTVDKFEKTRVQYVVQKWNSWSYGGSSRDFQHHANFVSRNMVVRLRQLPSGTLSIQRVSSSNSTLRCSTIWDYKNPQSKCKQNHWLMPCRHREISKVSRDAIKQNRRGKLLIRAVWSWLPVWRNEDLRW